MLVKVTAQGHKPIKRAAKCNEDLLGGGVLRLAQSQQGRRKPRH